MTIAAFLAAAILLDGAYRLDMRVVSRARVPVFGATESASVSVSLVDLRAGDEGLVQSHRVCDARIDGGVPGVRLVMPPPFIAALGTHEYPVRLDGDAYRADLGVEYVGYRPAGSGAPPARADDPAVYDWDGDGRPGATLRLVLPGLPDAELYVAQRGRSVLDGRVVAPGRVEGRVEVPLLEQAVIGARPGFVARAPAVVPEPVRSRFTLTRTPGARSCADVVGERTP